jgi:hypothetical protein
MCSSQPVVYYLDGKLYAHTSSKDSIGSLFDFDIESLEKEVVYKFRVVDTTNNNAVPVNLGDINFSVVDSGLYEFNIVLIYSSSNATSGLSLQLISPNSLREILSAGVDIYGFNSNGQLGVYHGAINSLNNRVTSTSTTLINIPYLASINGIIYSGTNGNVFLRWCPEINKAVTIKTGSFIRSVKIN